MEKIGVGISFEADSSRAVQGFNELNKSIEEVKNNSKKINLENLANDPFSLAQREREKQLPSFIQDFGNKTRQNPFIEIPDIGRFSKINDKELLNAFKTKKQLKNKILQNNGAVYTNNAKIKQIKDEFKGSRIPFYKKQEIQNLQKWNDYLKADNRRAKKDFKSVIDVNEDDLKDRLKFRIAGGELPNDKYVGNIKENVEEIVKELQSINKNTKENDNPNNLPSTEKMGQTAPEGKAPDSSSFGKTLNYALKSSPYAIAAKAIVDTVTNVLVDNSQIRNSQRSRTLGMVNGDIVSAENSSHNIAYLKEKRTLDIASGSMVAGGVGLGAAIGSVVPGVGTTAGALAGLIIGGAGALYTETIGKKIAEAEKAEADSKTQFMHGMSSVYQNTLPMYEQGVSVFYDRKNESYDNDLDLFRRGRQTLSDVFVQYARDTGLSIADFGSHAIELAKEGIGENHPEKAAAYIKRAAQWANYTGGNIDEYNSFLGLTARYGKESENSLDIAFGASQASGLGRAQFGEFLQGLESVISTGISKGFVRSTEDVSKTMATLSLLSNGSEFWKGEQGFQRLNQLNTGIANATSLADTTQILTYQAMKNSGLSLDKNGKDSLTYIEGQDVLNTFALMEKGIDGKSLRKISETFDNAFGNDIMQNVMALKELSGLNFTGAMQLYNMTHGKNYSETELDKMVSDLQKAPSYSSEKSIQQDMLNELQSMGEKLGMSYFRQELSVLKGYVKDIASETNKSRDGSFFYSNEYSRYERAIESMKEEMYQSGELDYSLDNEAASELAYQKFMREDEWARNNNKPYDSANPFDVALENEARKLSVTSGYTKAIEVNRLQKIIDEISESRNDSNPANDKKISDYDDRYKSALIQLMPLLERIANASEKTAVNTNEMEIVN